jgi:hypothetical protein
MELLLSLVTTQEATEKNGCLHSADKLEDIPFSQLIKY